MRLIDADSAQAYIKKIYRESSKRKDTELMKLLSVCNEIINAQPTVGPEQINEKYQSLDDESRTVIDFIINKLEVNKVNE